jgi:hypothetical protein
MLEEFEAERPKPTKYVVKRKVMEHLEEHCKEAISDKQALSLWSMEVLILAQEEFDNAYAKKNGPGKLAIVPHVFSSFIKLYGLYKRAPSLLKKEKVIRAVTDICLRCSKDVDMRIGLQKMTQMFLQRARSPEPSPPQTPCMDGRCFLASRLSILPLYVSGFLSGFQSGYGSRLEGSPASHRRNRTGEYIQAAKKLPSAISGLFRRSFFTEGKSARSRGPFCQWDTRGFWAQ